MGDRLPALGELAKTFQCSVGTVSKAVALLAHAGFVDQRKKAGIRVLRTAATSGGARTQADAFALIYPSERHEGIRRMVEGFQAAADAAKCRIVTLTTGTDYRKEAEYFSRLPEFDVKGVMIHPVFPTPQDQVDFSQMLVGSNFPVVLGETSLPGLGCHSVSTDGAHAAYVMTRRLLEGGCRRVGFFANNVSNANVRDKYLGYRQAMDEGGLGDDARRVFLEPTMHPNFEDPLREPAALARAYLQRHADVDGIVCANDFLAHGCLIAARELGIPVPDAIKITGMNDFQSLPPQSPALTTYRFPYDEIGRRAFEVLKNISEGRLGQPLDSFVRGTLIGRESA